MCWRCSCRPLLSARSPSRIKQAFAVPVAVSADQALHLWPPVAQCRTVGGVLNRYHHPVNQRACIVGTQVIKGVISNAGGEQLAVEPAQDPLLAASLFALRRGPPCGAHVNQIACADVEAWTLPVDQEGVAKVGRDRREEVGEVCVTVNEGEVLLVSHPVFELSLPVAEESGQQALVQVHHVRRQPAAMLTENLAPRCCPARKEGVNAGLVAGPVSYLERVRDAFPPVALQSGEGIDHGHDLLIRRDTVHHGDLHIAWHDNLMCIRQIGEQNERVARVIVYARREAWHCYRRVTGQ